MDIRIQHTNMDGVIGFDLSMDGTQFSIDQGLETSVIISLFTDRRADADEVLPDGSGDLRGWFGDSMAEVVGDRIGSLLWLLWREKQTQKVLVRARDYARDALKWLVEDGLAKRADVEASYPRAGVLALAVEIERPDGSVSRYRYERFWGDSNGA